MLRYRRYRVFVVLAVAVVFLLYQFSHSGANQWDTGKYSAEYLRQQLGLKSAGDAKTGDSSAGPGARDEQREEQKPIEVDIPAKTKEEGTVTPPPHLEDVPKPPKQALPEDKTPVKDEEAPAAAEKAKTAGGDNARVLPGPSEPWRGADVPGEAGEGRQEVAALPAHDQIHFSKPSELFPVKSVIHLPTGAPKKMPRIQHEFKADDALGEQDLEKLDSIKDVFVRTWKGYKERAWGKDELRPKSGDSKDSFNSWGATLVDTLDTLWIMGLKDEFEEAVQKVEKIDFTTSVRQDIPLFETTIRYLGGLLAAYDVSGGKYPSLLTKAEQLGNVLYGAFDTPNRMPIPFYHWQPSSTSKPLRSSNHMIMSELGSLSLEFTRLAQLTKNDKYYDAVARVTDALEEWQDKTPLPGLWPMALDASGCDRQQYQTASKQTDGSSTLTVIDKYGNEKLDPDQKPLDESGPTLANFDPKKYPDGIGIPAQVEFSRIKDHQEKTEVPPGYVEIERPPPIEFKVDKPGPQSGMPGKAGSIEKIDGESARKQQSSEQFLDDLDRAGPGKIQYIEIGKDGKEKPRGGYDGQRTSSEEKSRPDLPDRARGKIQYVEVGRDGVERPRGGENRQEEEGKVDTKEDLVGQDKVPKKIQYVDVGRDGVERPRQEIQSGDDIEDGPKMPSEEPSGAGMDDDFEYRKLKKRQLTTSSGKTVETVPKPKAAGTTNPAGDHSGAEDQTCLPQGLASVQKYGRDEFTLGSNADSTYEYLPKEYILLGGSNEQYRTMYDSAIKSANKHLIYRPMLPDENDILLAGSYVVYTPTPGTPKKMEDHLVSAGSHLTCFVGGMYGLGAKIFDRPDDMEIAKKLTDGCVWAYASMPTGIMAETFKVLECEDMNDCKWNLTRYYQALDPGEERRWNNYNKMVEEMEKPNVGKPTAEGTHEEKKGPAKENDYLYSKQAPDSPAREPEKTEGISKRDTESSGKSMPVWQPPEKNNSPTKVDDAAPASSPETKSSAVEKLLVTPPQTHEDFVEQRIKEERLPPGYVAVTDRRYLLRPEAIESVFYMHRLTGDPHWRQAGWAMFQAVAKHTRAAFGHSAIDDVTSASPRLTDAMESFWTAETLKYFYLLFEEHAAWSLDDWVFNTEAHPLRRPDAPRVPVAPRAKAD